MEGEVLDRVFLLVLWVVRLRDGVGSVAAGRRVAIWLLLTSSGEQ